MFLHNVAVSHAKYHVHVHVQVYLEQPVKPGRSCRVCLEDSWYGCAPLYFVKWCSFRPESTTAIHLVGWTLPAEQLAEARRRVVETITRTPRSREIVLFPARHADRGI